MHKVVVQEGYSLPFEDFGAARRRRRTKRKRVSSRRRGRRTVKRKRTMKTCGRLWRKKTAKFKRTHKWSAFVRKCMKAGRKKKR